MNLLDKVMKAKEVIEDKYNGNIDFAIVLGSGLGDLANKIENTIVIPYSDIPGFPKTTVVGHKGELIIGDLSGKKVLAFNGRFHYYEGYSMEDVTIGIRVAQGLNIKKLIISNAAGGMNLEFKPGDLMVITDHINMTGDNPLIGENIEKFGPRFPDMSSCYDKEYIDKVKEIGNSLGINLVDGVYTAITGPNYQSPAELRMLRIIGGDAVGMSTVPEVIVANHGSMRVLGISVITDMALWDSLEPLEHSAVIETANKANEKFIKLIEKFIMED